jgi:hypothetical protein
MLQRLLRWLKGLFWPRQHRVGSGSYFFLRIGKAQRWEQNETGELPTVEEAAKDLELRPQERGLSIYRLDHKDEITDLAALYSLTLRDNPAHFECVIFPASLLLDYRIEAVPEPKHLSFLSDRHHEILDSSEQTPLQLAELILNSPDKKVQRIRRQEIVDFAIKHKLLEKNDFLARVSNKWRKMIEKKVADGSELK